MATRNHLIGTAQPAGLRPGRLGLRLAAAGEGLALYATVLVLMLIGGLKFTAYEAAAIRPLVETSSFLTGASRVTGIEFIKTRHFSIRRRVAKLLPSSSRANRSAQVERPGLRRGQSTADRGLQPDVRRTRKPCHDC